MLQSVAEGGDGKTGFLTETTRTTLSNGPVRLGVSSGQEASMLIPASRTDKIEDVQKSVFISVNKVTLVVDGSRLEFINVSCDEPQLDDVFAKVASDILRRIEHGRPGNVAIDEALKEFRRLLRSPSMHAPDIRVAAGLVGELLVLIKLLERDHRAWSGWHGPAADRHDFRAGGISIETKASLGADGRKVYIHGIRQLETDPGDILVIKHIRLEVNPAGDLNVPGLARKAVDLASDPNALEKRLRALGYSEQVSDDWGFYSFRKFDEAAYQVLEGFPRLVPGLLNVQWPLEGVSQLSYELDLAAANDFALTQDDWANLIRDFCACL
jgi:hypothetical protein